MRRFVIFTACSFVLLTTLPAHAATKDVSIVDFSFSPKREQIAQGGTVTWTNDGAFTHTSTQDSPLARWDTGGLSPGASGSTTINWAGTYPYHCAIHTSMVGAIKVPVKVSPATGTVGSTFTITMATEAAPSGYTYDVQKKVGDNAWKSYQTGLTTATTTFMPSAANTYAFRSRLHRTSDDATSKWSPAKKITVS
jgi:plastocyanin